LVFHETVLESAAGVQQGDNLGPLLFALVLHPLLARLKAIPGLDVVIGYLDDIALAGDDVAVMTALDLIGTEAQSMGLHLNLGKCVVAPTAGGTSQAQLGMLPAAVKRCLDGNFKFLGAPVGDREFCARFTREKRIDKAAAMLEMVPELHDAQAAHKLLMHCLGTCKVMYAMRTTRPDWIATELAGFDAALRETFETATGLALSSPQWSQATLSLKRGGMGLRSAALHASAAYLASRAATWELCQTMDPAFRWEEGMHGDAISAAKATYNGLVAGPNQLAAGPPSSEAAGQQKLMSDMLEGNLFEQLLSQAPPAQQARLRAVAAPHAGSWLQALPSPGLDQRLTHQEFAAATRLRLGCAVLGHDQWCPLCDQVFDTAGAHSLTCMAGGHALSCHNAVRDYVYLAALRAGLNPQREEGNLLPDDPRRRPGDLYFALWPGSTGVAMDFAVTSPLQHATVHEAAGRTLAAAARYEHHKLDDRDTAAKCQAWGVRLVPMVAESFGGWGAMAQKAFKVICAASANHTGDDNSLATSQFYEGLGIKLARASARSLLARVALVTPAELGSGVTSRALNALTATAT